MEDGHRNASTANPGVAVTGRFVIAPLSEDDDRSGFACGIDLLDRYFKHQAGQDQRRHLAHCFVARDAESGTIAGYFSLSATSILLADLPEALTRRLPRYDKLPAVLVGRLAVDLRFRGRRLGEALLVNAIYRAHKSDPAVFAVVVDAISAEAAAFYRKYQFTPFDSRPLSLFLPISFINKLPLDMP
jgi:predicted GNAT family N-acyltransferase